MSRRRRTKAERERVITLDLLADWRAMPSAYRQCNHCATPP